MSMPSYVALQSNHNQKYLHYLNENEQAPGFLKFSGERVVSPFTKYKVEEAGNGLVHIRSCYNNKYWVRWSPKHHWIVAGANEPDIDQSKWSCTLFKPEYLDSNKTTVRLLHVQLKHYTSLKKIGDPYGRCLYADSKSHYENQCDVFTIIDFESLFVLPKHVAFMGDNDRYLRATPIIGPPLIDGVQHIHLQFASLTKLDPLVWTDVFNTPNGSVCFRNVHFGKYWRRDSTNFIQVGLNTVDTNSNDNLPDALFWAFWQKKLVHSVKDNKEYVTALRNNGNNLFCQREARVRDLLSASASTPNHSEALIKVDELVISRRIYDVKYFLKDARIYNKRIVKIGEEVVVNNTCETKNEHVKISYKSKSRTWNSSISMKLYDKTHLDALVPVIIKDDMVVISDERFDGEYKWGETITNPLNGVRFCSTSPPNEEETAGYKVTLAPKTKVTVTLVATQGSCDVPFFYTQHDTHINGKLQDIEVIRDGVYTGINWYDYKYEPKVEKLNVCG